MGGLLIFGLLVLLVVKAWPFLLGAVFAFMLWRFVFVPIREARERELRDRVRHERARREIDRIAAETTQAMYAATARSGDVIEGYAEEVES
jgi:hypothetical protein